jgi:hypothetical protein
MLCVCVLLFFCEGEHPHLGQLRHKLVRGRYIFDEGMGFFLIMMALTGFAHG